MKPAYEPNFKRIQEEFALIINPKNSEGLSIHVFVKSRLRQFKLDQKHNNVDILLECYQRLNKALEQGKSITNLKAWIRSTAYNYIRELKREEKRHVEYQDYLVDNQTNNQCLSEEETNKQYQMIQEALSTLPLSDQELILWKEVNGLSWKAIQLRLEKKGKSIHIDTLRKRKSRAIKNLRIAYCELEKNSCVNLN